MSEVIGAGLRIEQLNEHEKLAWQFAPAMAPTQGRRRILVLPEGFPRMALAYSIRARKE